MVKNGFADSSLRGGGVDGCRLDIMCMCLCMSDLGAIWLGVILQVDLLIQTCGDSNGRWVYFVDAALCMGESLDALCCCAVRIPGKERARCVFSAVQLCCM